MLNEPASSYPFEYHTPETEDKQSANGHQRDDDAFILRLHDIISDYMAILQEAQLDESLMPAEDRAILARGDSDLLMTYAGVLRDDAETVYSELDKRLREWDMYPLLRMNIESNEQPHVIHIVRYRPEKPQEWSPMLNIVLLIATIISVLLTGTTIAVGELAMSDPLRAQVMMSSIGNLMAEMWRGFPYAFAIMAILGTHEMGHYFMMRRHNSAATLPFFIPGFLISPFGTLGAAIVLRESLKNRKTLLDVGAWGPISGFIVAIPILFIGLATSQLIPTTTGGMIEGNSILYAVAKFMVFGEWLPNANHDVLVNQLAWAGWTGLFVTALNMIPLGQLDGGHVLYSLFGDRARVLYYPILAVMVFMVLFVSSAWLVFIILLFFVGRVYAVPLDNITPLDTRRRWLGIAALIIFVLTFTPIPIYIAGASGGLLNSVQLGALAVALLVTLPRWLRQRRS